MNRHPYAASPAQILLAAPAKTRSSEDVQVALAKTRSDGAMAIQIGVRLGVGLPKTTPDGRAATAASVSRYAAIVLARGPVDATLGASGGPGGASNSIDPRGVGGSLAERNSSQSTPPGSILVTMLTTRLGGFTRAAYCDRWLTGHAPFGLRIDAAGYRQLHADATVDPTPGLPSANTHDGIGMVMFRDLEHVALAARRAGNITRRTADEMRFIDHSRSMLMMFRLLE